MKRNDGYWVLGPHYIKPKIPPLMVGIRHLNAW
jgi:hypothetical protein